MRSLARWMKKVVPAMLLFLLLAGVTLAPAQVPSAQPAADGLQAFTYGVRAGVLYNDFTGDAVGEDDGKVGFNGGLFMNYRFSRHFALQPELAFAVRSGDVTHRDVLMPTERVSYTFGMLDLPVLLKYYPWANHSMQPSLFVGPMASYHLYRDVEPVEDMEPQFDDDDQYRAGMLGVTFGIGLEKRAFGRNIQFDTRYVMGLTDLFRDEQRPDFRLEGWTVSVGLGF